MAMFSKETQEAIAKAIKDGRTVEELLKEFGRETLITYYVLVENWSPDFTVSFIDVSLDPEGIGDIGV